MRRGSLRLRFLLAGAISVVAALVVSAVGLSFLFERHVERRVEGELEIYLAQLVAGLDHDADGPLVVAVPPADPRFSRPLSGLYWQVQGDGTLLRSRSLWDASLAMPADELADGAVHRHRIVGPADAELIALERRVILPARLGGGTVRAVVALDSTEITAARRGFTVDLMPYLVLLGFVLILAAYAQVTVGLRPLAAVRQRLAAIREGKSRRLGLTFPDEIQPLAAEIDGLLEAREAQIEKARSRAGDLAHGLKTPLQVISGDVRRLREKGEDAIAGDIEQVAAIMHRHVDRELARARTAAGTTDARARVVDVAERVVGVVARTPSGAEAQWLVDVPADLVAHIDADDLAEALGNLLENATRHARTRVSIVGSRRDGRILVAVTDDGPGIPADRIEQALSRGGRLDRLGEGAGLGLAIVRDIADAWGGQLDLRTGPPGFTAEFIVPAAPGSP